MKSDTRSNRPRTGDVAGLARFGPSIGDLLRRPEAGALIGMIAVLIFFVDLRRGQFPVGRWCRELAQRRRRARHHRHSRSVC